MDKAFSIDSSIVYSGQIGRRTLSVYWLVLCITVLSIIALPFIELEISVKASGIVRPREERAELKAGATTVIEAINFKEGELVNKGEVVVRLRMENLGIKRSMNVIEIAQRDEFIRDLTLLTQDVQCPVNSVRGVRSPLYKQQTSRFLFQLSELDAVLRKVTRELRTDSLLAAEKIIAPKEMFDKQVEFEKLVATIQLTRGQQIAAWQQELVRYKIERNQFQNANQQLEEDSNLYTIRSPVRGVLQSFNKYYPGSLVQAGELLGIVSPESMVVVECYINTADVGLLRVGQGASFRVDAFDYKYFGWLSGRIISIDNDYTLVGEKPGFKVRCLLERTSLQLKNGFSGNVKKGMTVQVRFLVTRRNLWQLMLDNVDDWANPIAMGKSV